MRERILITGGSGFIGACLARDLIASGANVHLLLRPEFRNWRLKDILDEFTLHWADIRDADAVRKAVETSKPDIIYNLATHGAYPTQNDRVVIFATNMQGTLNLIDALARRDYRALVHAGSSSEYGFKNGPMRADDVLESRSDYAIGKAAASLLVLAEAFRGKPNTVVRVFSAYGPWEEPSRLVPYVMGCCARGEDPRVTSGHQPRDFIYVDDVVALLKTAANLAAARGKILHAGTGCQSRVRDMIEAIVAASGKRVRPQYGTAQMHPYEPTAWVASIEKTKALTGWKPHFDLKSGVNAMWHWHQETWPRMAA
jgi:nucleoside-diphosphate-sugar epimerase